MKKALIFLLISLLTLAVGVGTYYVFIQSTPKSDSEVSEIQANATTACGSGTANQACRDGYSYFEQYGSVDKAKTVCGDNYSGRGTTNCIDGVNKAADARKTSSSTSKMVIPSQYQGIADNNCKTYFTAPKYESSRMQACITGFISDASSASKACSKYKTSEFVAACTHGYNENSSRKANAESKSGSSSGSSSGGFDSGKTTTSGTSTQSTQNTGNASAGTDTSKTGLDESKVKDPKSGVECNGGKGVRLGTEGLGTNCVGVSGQNPIFALIATFTKFAIGLLGLVFVLMVVISGFQYTISRGNPDETKGAKERLEHAVTGIILLVLMTAILNTIIPGGILK